MLYSEQWWKHELDNARADGYKKGIESGLKETKEWQGLSDDEQSNIFKNQLGHDCSCDPHSFYLAIEQALKEKNTP
jgi:hypothetical protein